MPRKKRRLLKIKPFPDRRQGVTYRLDVVEVRDDQEHDELYVTVRHLDLEQLGRTEFLSFPLPLHTEGPAADFLSACGFDPRAGETIDLDAVVGAVVGARFEPSEKGASRIAAFIAIDGENNNESGTASQPLSNQDAKAPSDSLQGLEPGTRVQRGSH